ncbi:MAG: hypothetical protein R3C14_44430 [Caldilineaceae bacterium]
MDLRTLIPDVATFSQPLDRVIGDDGAGLTHLVNLLENQDIDGAAGALGNLFMGELANVIPSDGALPFTGAVTSLSNLSGLIGAPPDNLFSGIQGPLGEIDQALTRLPQIVESVTAIADGIEQARGGDLGPVLQRAGAGLNQLLQAVTGPDLAGFGEWQAYLGGLQAELQPLIDAGGSPAEIRQRLLDAALARIADVILGLAPELTALLGEAAGVLNGLLPDVPGLNLEALRDTALGHLQAITVAANGGGGDIPTLIAEFRIALHTLTDTIHNTLDALEPNLNHPLLTPGSVTAIVDRELARIEAIQVDDFSNVPARVESFFTTIEGAIDQVDFSAIGNEITGFFQQLQDLIGQLNPASVAQELDAVRSQIDGVVQRLQELLTMLTARIQGWLTELTTPIQNLFDQLGSTGPDGHFHFFFEADLEQLYGRIDALIQGNPDQPDAFSLRQTLENFQATFVNLVNEAEGTLTGLADELIGVRDELAGALSGVRTELENVDPQAVMEQATTALEGAFEAIGGLEFDAVVDPVIEELDDARDELAQIDLSSLNDLLRAALQAALDAITTSDFDVEITGALLAEVDELLAPPRQVLNTIADKINELVNKVLAISPQALLDPVQAQLDRLTAALHVDFGPLLAPLTAAYDDFIARVHTLDPAQFLTPMVEVFQQVQHAVDELRPERLLEPVQTQIDRVANALRSLDLGSQLTAVKALFADFNGFLDSIDPATLLQPLNEPFAAVERALETLRPSVLLAPVSAIMDQIAGLTDVIPDGVITQLRALYDQALARVDSLNPTAALTMIRGLVDNLRSRLRQLQPGALLHALQTQFDQTRVALAAADSRDGTSFAVSLDVEAPTLAFGAVVGRYERVEARLTNALNLLDPAPLLARFDQARARIEELLPRAVRDDITAENLQTLLGLTNPAQWITRLDSIYQRILDKLNQISPAIVITPLSATYQTVRSALSAIDLGQLIAQIEHVLDQVGAVVGSISLTGLITPITTVVNQVKAMVAGLDPSPLIDAFRSRFNALITLLDQFKPTALVEPIQSAWDRVAGRIDELFDLETILEPLLAIFEAIRTILAGLDAGQLVAVLDEKLEKLRDELEEALQRTGAAFKAMLAAIPLGGSSGASASIGV